jgi:hypothetical protein
MSNLFLIFWDIFLGNFFGQRGVPEGVNASAPPQTGQLDKGGDYREIDLAGGGQGEL